MLALRPRCFLCGQRLRDWLFRRLHHWWKLRRAGFHRHILRHQWRRICKRPEGLDVSRGRWRGRDECARPAIGVRSHNHPSARRARPLAGGHFKWQPEGGGACGAMELDHFSHQEMRKARRSRNKDPGLCRSLRQAGPSACVGRSRSLIPPSERKRLRMSAPETWFCGLRASFSIAQVTFPPESCGGGRCSPMPGWIAITGQ